MSRSSRREPVAGVTAAATEKLWKQQSNRRLRRASQRALATDPAGALNSLVLPLMNEMADVWDSPKEGKLRFDPANDPKRMRK